MSHEKTSKQNKTKPVGFGRCFSLKVKYYFYKCPIKTAVSLGHVYLRVGVVGGMASHHHPQGGP